MTGAFTHQIGSRNVTLGLLGPILPPAFLTFYLILILVFSKSIIEAITNFFVIGPSGPRKGNNLFISLLFFLFITIVIAILSRSNPAVLLAFLGALQQAATLFTSATRISHSQTAWTSNVMMSATQSSFLIYYSFIVFGAIFVVSLTYILIAFHRGVVSNRSDVIVPGYIAKEKATEIVRRTVKMLESGRNYHDTILDCYRQMCILLGETGLMIGSEQTAREFSLQASNKLQFGREAVQVLTFLFEEARYSQHSLDDRKRSLAISQLRTLERELGDVLAMNLESRH